MCFLSLSLSLIYHSSIFFPFSLPSIFLLTFFSFISRFLSFELSRSFVQSQMSFNKKIKNKKYKSYQYVTDSLNLLEINTTFI